MDRSLDGRLIHFEATDKVSLEGFISEPSSRRKGIVVHIHGLTGNFHRTTLFWELANLYNRNGYALFSINTRGANIIQRLPKKKGKKTEKFLAGTAFERFEHCAYDIEGAVRYCRKQGYRNIILQGHSTGCQKAVYYQAKRKDGRIKALVLLAPGDDLNIQKQILGRKFDRAIEVARRLAKRKELPRTIMPYEYYPGIIGADRFLSFSDENRTEAKIFDYHSGRFSLFRRIKTPIATFFGDQEEYSTMPIEKYLFMLEKASNSREFRPYLIKGGNHGFFGKEKELGETVVNWLNSLKLN